MSRLKDMGLDVTTFFNGRPAFIAGVLDAMHIPQAFDQAHAEHREVGRVPDIAYGVLAKLLLVNICDQHHPLYRMAEYFEDKDLELITGFPVETEQLHDDRFGDFLDQFALWGPRKVFSHLASQVFMQYNLSIRSLNYDTTSKVMWGEYEESNGKVGTVSITLGHSKAKRGDKNQLKIGLGVADGVILDAKVLSGNMDDKTYNNQAIDDVDVLLSRHGVDRNDFYYVADSAFFTEDNLRKANKSKILFITRVPDNVKLADEFIRQAWSNEALSIESCEEQIEAGSTLGFRDVLFCDAHGQEIPYRVQDLSGNYRGQTYQCAVCYSPRLESSKRKTTEKAVSKECGQLEDIAKTYRKRSFACEEDANKEIATLEKKVLSKVKFHRVEAVVQSEEKKRRGRPRKNPSEQESEYVFSIQWQIHRDKEAVERHIKYACTFVLATNDKRLRAEQILTEYKTQSSVEKKFQQLKSPQFVNSLYLKSPQRIEALVYMILIAMMVLSVVERVVRREMHEHNQLVIGPGKVRQTRPSLRAILDIFGHLPVNRVVYQGVMSREFIKGVTPSQQIILDHLRLPPDLFTRTITSMPD